MNVTACLSIILLNTNEKKWFKYEIDAVLAHLLYFNSLVTVPLGTQPFWAYY